MHLILDTNVFFADFWMEHRDFTVLKDSMKRISAHLVVPSVVLDEVEQKYRDRMEEALRESAKAQKTLRAISRRGTDLPVLPKLESEHRSYCEFLRAELGRLGAKIAPLPSVSHADILKRAIQKKRPFDHNGAGYRDALIWASVLEVTKDPRNVCFVSADGDFVGGDERLHAELFSELGESAKKRFEFFRSLAAFNEKWITPHLRRLDQLVADFDKGSDLAKRIQAAVISELSEFEDEVFGEVGLGLPDGSASIYLDTKTIQVSDLTANDARRLASGNVVLKGHMEFKAEISASIREWNYDRLPLEKRLELQLRPGDDVSIDFPPHDFRVGFAVTLATDDLVAREVEITSVRGDLSEISWD